MRSLKFVIPALLISALAGCGGGGGGGGTPTVPPTVTINGLPAGAKLNALTNYPLSVTETQNGASVTPGIVTYKISTATVGTISGSTLQTSLGNASGTLTATDSTHGVSANVTVAVGSTHPATAGDTVSFAGTLTERIVRPQPAPVTVQPPYTLSYAVSITSTTATGKTFAGKTGLDEFTTVESDTGSLPALPVTTTATFEQTAAAAAGAYDVVSYGSQASDTNGSTYKTTLGAGNGLLGILPETSGRTWQNNAAETYAEAEPDSTTIARTQAADGAYTETDTFADPTLPAARIDVLAGPNGTYTNVFGGATLTFAPPQAGVGGAKVIPIAITEGGATTNEVIADWYPTATLYSNSVRLLTGQAIPSACKVPASLGTTATETSETTTRLDPVLGTYESRRDATYLVPFYGTACTVSSDTLQDYYDYSGQSAATLGSVLQQQTTLNETLGFRSGTIAGSAVIASAGAKTQTAIAAAQTRAALTLGRASFNRAVQRLYTERRRALATRARNTTSLHWMGR